MKKKKKKNNTIVRYSSSMNEYNGSMALYEYINSYRESNDSPHPKLRSETTMKALKKLKEMKDEIGEEIFKAPDDEATNSFFGMGPPNFLFIRYFYNFHVEPYKASPLPGYKEGVSGSVVIPNNVGIIKYISEDKKKAAAEYLKFMFSKESQKKYIISNFMVSAINELYNDEEVCSMMECEIMKGTRPFSFMSNDEKLFADDNYHIKYRETLFEYLYKNEPMAEILQKIDDVTRIYEFSLKTDDSNAGLIIFIIFLVLSISIILSLGFIFIENFEKRFNFLSKDLWIITTLGSVILMCSIITLYGKVTNAGCQERVILINVGFILSICPSFHRLITNFPEKNNIVSWVEKNKYIFIFIIMIFTLSLNGLLAISSYEFEELTTPDGENFKKCIMKSKFGNVVFYFVQVYNFFIILVSLGLIYLEWNIRKTAVDIKYLATALFMDSISLILFNILDKFEFKDYIVYNTLLAINILIFSLLNHLFIYLIRIMPMFGNVSELEDSRKILGKVSSSGITESKKITSYNNTSSRNIEKTTTMSTSASSNHSKLNGITKKIMDCHNQTSISIN